MIPAANPRTMASLIAAVPKVRDPIAVIAERMDRERAVRAEPFPDSLEPFGWDAGEDRPWGGARYLGHGLGRPE